MNLKKIFTIALLIPAFASASLLDFIRPITDGFRLGGDITPVDQWIATTTPESSMTQRVNGRAVRISGKLLDFEGDAGSNGNVLISTATGTNWVATSTLGISGGGSISDGDKGDITVSSSGAVWTIDNSAVSYAKIQDSAGLSVLGRSANTTGVLADITAGSDGNVLRRSGTSIGFGAINLASSNAVTGDLPFANLTQGSALSVLGVAGNATADVASIAASNDGNVLRRSGTSIGFGAISLASSNAVTGTLGIGNGGTGATAFGASRVPFMNTGNTALTSDTTFTFVTSESDGTLHSARNVRLDRPGYSSPTILSANGDTARWDFNVSASDVIFDTSRYAWRFEMGSVSTDPGDFNKFTFQSNQQSGDSSSWSGTDVLQIFGNGNVVVGSGDDSSENGNVQRLLKITAPDGNVELNGRTGTVTQEEGFIFSANGGRSGSDTRLGQMLFRYQNDDSDTHSKFDLQVNNGAGLYSALTAYADQSTELYAPMKLKGYEVSSLPTGVEGQIAYVTDADSPTFLGTLTGGGSTRTPVFFDGTNWVAY